MDYLQEVERRQRATLTRLLTGDAPGRRLRRKRNSAAPRCVPARRQGGRSPSALPGGQTAAAERRKVVIPETTEQRTALQETQEEPVRLDSKEALSEQEAAFFQARQADAMWRNANIPGGQSAGNPAG